MKVLCKYKDIFGIPGEGFHKIRFFGMALGDIILTILLAIILFVIFVMTGYMNKNIYSFLYILIVCFLWGIILHKLFCVRTTVDKLIFT